MKLFDKEEMGRLIAAIHSLSKDKVRELALLMWQHIHEVEAGNSPELPDGWIPCAERMPEFGVVVLVYSPPQPGDYPGDVRIGFDFIDPDGDDPNFWHEHGENYEHFCCVAGGLEGCSGPSEKAPYTHWQPLPAPPTTEK